MIPQIYKSPQRWEIREANKATSRIMETSNVKVNFLINLCDWKTFVCSEDVIFGGRRFPCFPSISHVLKGPLHVWWGCIKIQCLVHISITLTSSTPPPPRPRIFPGHTPNDCCWDQRCRSSDSPPTIQAGWKSHAQSRNGVVKILLYIAIYCYNMLF